jgi:hypothetical protein
MREGSRWITGNAARFAVSWFVALTLGVLVIPGEGRLPAPDSILGIVSLPLAVCVIVISAAVVAFVGLVFFAPVLGLWFAVYLMVVFGLGRALASDRSARLAAVVAAPLLWVPFVHSGDRLVDGLSLAVTCLYGFLVQLWPIRRPASPMPTRREAA